MEIVSKRFTEQSYEPFYMYISKVIGSGVAQKRADATAPKVWCDEATTAR